MKMIDAGLIDRAGRPVTLRGVDDDNWRAVADVVPRDDQRDWVATSAARYLLLSEREGLWTSLGIFAADEVTGHLMYAYDEDDDRYWVGGMLVDEPSQGTGIGRASLVTLLRYLLELPDCQGVRLAVHEDNAQARKLYASVGFTELKKDDDGDWTAELTELVELTDSAASTGSSED